MFKLKRNFKNILLIGSVFFLSACNAENSTTEGDVMLNGTAKNYVIFSPMEGVLLKDGEPLANTKIIRTLRWNGNDETGLVEEFMTDDNGNFSLPIHEETLSLNMLSQFVGKSKLHVLQGDQEILIWYTSKLRDRIFEETDGPIKNLVCDVATEENVVSTKSFGVMTRCSWQSI